MLAGHSSQAQADSAASDREIVLSRVFDAPRELVFKAWTDSRHVAEWWGRTVSPPPSTRWMCGLAACGGS